MDSSTALERERAAEVMHNTAAHTRCAAHVVLAMTSAVRNTGVLLRIECERWLIAGWRSTSRPDTHQQ